MGTSAEESARRAGVPLINLAAWGKRGHTEPIARWPVRFSMIPLRPASTSDCRDGSSFSVGQLPPAS